MRWWEYLNEKNQECFQKSKEDGLYTGEYVESDMRQTPNGACPIQHTIHCMRCGTVISDRRNTSFHGNGVMTHLSEEDELKAFPLMRKIRVELKGVRDGMKVMVCGNCVEHVLSGEDKDRLMFTVVAGHTIFFEQCGRDPDFIRKQVKDLERLEIKD